MKTSMLVTVLFAFASGCATTAAPRLIAGRGELRGVIADDTRRDSDDDGFDRRPGRDSRYDVLVDDASNYVVKSESRSFR